MAGPPDKHLDVSIHLVEHDDGWTDLFDREADRLEAVGYTLRRREPGWFEHRLFNGPDIDANVHVFSADCAEIDRMVRFRDHLRTSKTDRELYERTKRELAARRWRSVQDYADAKTEVVAQIFTRIEGGQRG